MQGWMIWAGFGAVVLFFVVLYNRFISLVQARKNAFSDIDVQLKLRYDLVPNLIETVKGYAAHEKSVLENVTTARAAAMRGGSISDRIGAEAALTSSLMSLMAVAENYPQLKANDNFRQLQSELADIENKIAAARRFFNSTTGEYNTAIRQFPGVLLARLFGFSEEIFFELSAGEKDAANQAPKVGF